MKIIFVIILLSVGTLQNLRHLPGYKVHFLDIGQGDAVLLRTPTNCTMVIDGGPPNAMIDIIGKYLPPNERKIDLLVLTHPHLDHMGGLIQLLKRFEVERVFSTGVSYTGLAYREFKKLSPVTDYVKAGEEYLLCGIKIKILYPSEQLHNQQFENVNDASIGMMLEIKGHKLLFTGDLEDEDKLPEEELDADIMKAGHHGSRTSNSKTILERASPKYLVIQSGRGNDFGHPHSETLQKAHELGIEILRNDKQGTITFFF